MSESKIMSIAYFFVENNCVTQRYELAIKWLQQKKTVKLRYVDTEGKLITSECPIKVIFEAFSPKAVYIRFKNEETILFKKPAAKLKVVSPSNSHFEVEGEINSIYNLTQLKNEVEKGKKIRCIYYSDPTVKTTTSLITEVKFGDGVKENEFITDTGVVYLYI